MPVVANIMVSKMHNVFLFFLMLVKQNFNLLGERYVTTLWVLVFCLLSR